MGRGGAASPALRPKHSVSPRGLASWRCWAHSCAELEKTMSKRTSTCPKCGEILDLQEPTSRPVNVNPRDIEYTLPEVKRMLGISKATVYRLMRDGHLRGTRLGAKGHWRFTSESIERLKRKRAEDGEEALRELTSRRRTRNPKD
jgi:excisionase family DNA binding protein